jgi:2-polyprenyl-6-hydroxyphenyl methylase/3-demethylubiquinone-9 3-methyltransferase
LKPLDKVAEAYHGGMGDQFSRKTRERIHWICSKVAGKSVLDVGCSQGITELILAREGKQAVGIDIEESSIAYANNSLENESESVKRNASFYTSSIFEFESEQKFDTVILTEVMEHFTSTQSLLEKIKNLLVDNGTIIITVPFGINDYFDHKKTYYMLNLLEEVEPYFKVIEIKFFGKWIGIVGSSLSVEEESESKSKLPRELVKQLEEAFYSVERTLVDELNSKRTLLNQYNDKIKAGREHLTRLQKENEELNQFTHLAEDDQEKINKYLEKIIELEEKLGLLEEKNKELELIKESKNKELLKRLDSEEVTLKRYEEAIFDYNQLEAKYANISKKYDLLSNAKLGRLTLNYWKRKKRIPKDF